MLLKSLALVFIFVLSCCGLSFGGEIPILIRERGYHVIPLLELVDSMLGGAEPPAHSVVLTADDGHESIYTEMIPRMKRYGFPVTLFIYPSAISNAK